MKAFIKKITSFTKKQMLLIGLVFAFILILIFTAFLINKNNKVFITSTLNSDVSALIPINKKSNKGIINESGDLKYKFTQQQQGIFQEVYNQNQSVALVIRVELNPLEEQRNMLTTGIEIPFNYGILYSEDFDKKGNLQNNINSIVSVYADLSKKLNYSDKNPVVLDISMAINKNHIDEENLPQGFFISSSVKCKILSCCIAPAEVGFDISQPVAFYGMNSNGGVIDFLNSYIDFSGASLVYPIQNTINSSMPYIVVKFDENNKDCSTINNSIGTRVTFGSEKVYIKKIENANEFIIPTASLKTPFNKVEITQNKDYVSSFIMKNFVSKKENMFEQNNKEVFEPIYIDPGMIIDYKMSNWRVEDYELFQWDRYPGILFFDFKDYDVQDNFLRRMAFFVEKAGYKGKLWSNEVLAGKHGYNAHDYSAQSMADFYNTATKQNFELNQEEITLKKILLYNGVLIADGDLVMPGEGAIVSISQESTKALRGQLFAHECWHTLFFKYEDFRNFVSAVYYTMDPDTRQFLIDYFASQSSLGYDTNDEYLMHNEFMAYILQQDVSEVAKYFTTKATYFSVTEYTPELASYIRLTKGKGFEDAAVILNDYVFDTYGIVAGNVSLVMR